jgi:CheY-like chemotaxis protein
VDDPLGKGVLLYDERPMYAESVAAALENLGVPLSRPASPGAFFTELEMGRFPFAFVSAGLAEGAAALISRLKSRTNLVLLGELGESSSFQDIPVILMPAYTLPVANILNGVSLNQALRKTIVPFIAPEARVLIVDDILTNLKVAQGLLLPYHMQVDICDNGKGAVALVKANNYDLIFMDHMMSGMDGIEATKEIRAFEESRQKEEARQTEKSVTLPSGIPIIALTANAIAGMREMFLSKGFNDYLAKPIEISRLNEIMGKWIPKEKRRKPDHVLRRKEKAQVMDLGPVLQLKKALEAGKTGTIDLILDELLGMPFKEEQKKVLSDIWNHVLAEEYKNAAALVNRLIG